MSSISENLSSPSPHRIGVVIVTYGAEDYVTGCLESLMASGYEGLRIIVVDNASLDRTTEVVRDWASGRTPFAPPEDWPLSRREPIPKPLDYAEIRNGDAGERAGDAEATVILAQMERNRGFAAGVNAGLRILAADSSIDHFWVLNPDTIVEPQTPFAFARKAREMGRFGVIGGRVLFLSAPEQVQTDAGRLHRFGFTAVSLNHGAVAAHTMMPRSEDVQYIPGVSMLVSRAFMEHVGPMDETYFLYFEEIDWQLRRGDLPFGLEPEARVLHRAGAAIGSGGWRRAASPFSIYFTCRNLLPFVGRWSPWRLPFAYGMAWAKLVRHWGLGSPQVRAFMCGLHGFGPPREVRARLPESVWAAVLAQAPAGATRMRRARTATMLFETTDVEPRPPSRH